MNNELSRPAGAHMQQPCCMQPFAWA